MTDRLVMEFSGYGLMRIPTDPDPTDDPRGVSGYTFAFGDEPDLDRVIRLQPPEHLIRSHAPPMGVTIKHAERRFADPDKDPVALPDLVGAKMDWLDGPKLENRNLILTEAGKEPIIPFNMKIWKEEDTPFEIYRTVPINSADPSQPVYKADPQNLAAMAAYGMYPEPDTVGRATGIWDVYKRALQRIALLEEELKVLEEAYEKDPSDELEGKIAVVTGRLKQLYIAKKDPSNRRITHSVMVERFSFPMDGGECHIKGDPATLGGILYDRKFGPKDTPSGWQISFWIGAWDSDLLCAYFEGTLQAPYAQ